MLQRFSRLGVEAVPGDVAPVKHFAKMKTLSELIEKDGIKYRPFYRVQWSDLNTCSDPDIEGDYDTLDEAKLAADTCEGDYWNACDEHYNHVRLMLQPMALDEDGEEYEDGKYIYADEEPLYSVSFGTREDDSQELLYTCQRELGDDIATHFGCEYSKYWSGKYGRLTRYYEDDEDNPLYIKLRIADHSYNPANNSDEHFLSVNIANKNETEGRFYGRHNMNYDGSATYDEILQDVINELDWLLG